MAVRVAESAGAAPGSALLAALPALAAFMSAACTRESNTDRPSAAARRALAISVWSGVLGQIISRAPGSGSRNTFDRYVLDLPPCPADGLGQAGTLCGAG
jgi:hypothetical protein